MLTSTESLSRTAIRVSAGSGGGRTVVACTHRLAAPTASSVRAVVVSHDAAHARVALVPDGALLLAGDAVELDIRVGDGARLDLIEPAGTVAFDMRGASARWDVRVHVGVGAVLTWAGEPFVVSAGARVRRSTRVTLAAGARLALRETVVLGRHGEAAGVLRQRTEIHRGRTPVLVEDLQLDPATAPVLLGGRRVVASVVSYGGSEPLDPRPDPDRYDLDAGGYLWRRLGQEAHEASLDHVWRWSALQDGRAQESSTARSV